MYTAKIIYIILIILFYDCIHTSENNCDYNYLIRWKTHQIFQNNCRLYSIITVVKKKYYLLCFNFNTLFLCTLKILIFL